MSETKISALPAAANSALGAASVFPLDDTNGTTVKASMAQVAQQVGSGPVFSVKAAPYNAVGDGVANDMPAIQAAVNACLAAGGGVVYFPAGQYALGNGTITVNNAGTTSIHFRGAGIYASRLVKGTTATGDVLTWNCTNAPTSITDLGITSALGGNFGVDALVTTSASLMNGCYFERLWVAGLRNGLVLAGSDLYISHCLVELCSLTGFIFDRNVTAHACTSYQNGSGFQVKDTSSVTYPPLSTHLVGCRDVESNLMGCYVYSRSNVELVDFQCQGSNAKPGTGAASGGGIVIETSSKVRITGGNIGNAGRGVQFIGACSKVTIDGITIDRCDDTAASSGYGIQLNSSCDSIAILNPVINRTYRSAIFHAAASNVKILGGYLTDFGRGAVAADLMGICLDGDSSSKGAEIRSVHFNSAQGQSIAWKTGAQGTFVVGRCTYAGVAGAVDITQAPKATTWLEQTPGQSADRGDVNYSIVTLDTPVQRFDTALTANRTATLPTIASNGQRFRVVRTGLGAFTLTVQTSTPTTIKAIPASTAAFVDVEYDGTNWKLIAYGTL